MLSPALLHYESKMAQKSGSLDADRADSQPYSILMEALGQDLISLSSVRSLEKKREKKEEYFGRYEAWVKGRITVDPERAVEKVGDDDIVGTIFIWSLDIEKWDFAIEIADFMLHFDMALPVRYSRNVATALADEIGDAFLERSVDVPASIFEMAIALIADHDPVDQAHAKLHKALGIFYAKKSDKLDSNPENSRAGEIRAYREKAIEHFERAKQLNPRVGVKKNIGSLHSKIKKMTDTQI